MKLKQKEEGEETRHKNVVFGRRRRERLGRWNQSVLFIFPSRNFYQWPLAAEKENSSSPQWKWCRIGPDDPFDSFCFQFFLLKHWGSFFFSVGERERAKARHKIVAGTQNSPKRKGVKCDRAQLTANKWSRHLVNNYAISCYELCLSSSSPSYSSTLAGK